jgi:uncharacterized protein (TIGR03086 family)
MSTPHPLYPHLRAAADETARVTRNVGADQLDLPTPATEWDVRTLANHLVLWTGHNLELRARGESVPEAWYTRDFTAETDWQAAYAEQLDAALAAWSAPEVWETEMPMGDAKVPAAAIAGMSIMELALHGWELATATGQEYAVEGELGEVLLKLVTENAELYRQFDGFAAPVDIPADAPAWHRALALSGRRPK